jgi:hypothetical protein
MAFRYGIKGVPVHRYREQFSYTNDPIAAARAIHRAMQARGEA